MATLPHNHALSGDCTDTCPVWLIRRAKDIALADRERTERDRPMSVPPGVWIPPVASRGSLGSGSFGEMVSREELAARSRR